jgi:2-iminobutanoate/2-iminopropanoate deaminase
MATLVKTMVQLVDRDDFPTMNELYAEYFTLPWPVRSTIVTTEASPELKFDIEAVAFLPQGLSALSALTRRP